MDLSGVIFVVLALAWALYLIPNALKRTDALAGDRPVEEYSSRMRILTRHARRTTPVAETDSASEGSEVVAAPEETFVPPPASRPLITRETARRAAQRRRRVLGLLTVALIVVFALAAFAVVPYWSLAVPGAMILGFLVIARLTVRRTQTGRGRVGPEQPLSVDAEPIEQAGPVVSTQLQSQVQSQPRSGSTPASAPIEPVEDVQQAIADEGSLWDPLPMTLPTYVHKAHARRTVRTIALTGMNSSGHDESDSKLADQAGTAARTDKDDDGHRKVAGA